MSAPKQPTSLSKHLLANAIVLALSAIAPFASIASELNAGAAPKKTRALEEVKERGWDFKKTQVGIDPVANNVWRATGVANAYIIATTAGSVVIDTGSNHQAREVMQLLESVAPGPIAKIILTHAHSDHVGGAKLWLDKYPDAELITHEAFPRMQNELDILGEYYGRRGAKILPHLVALSVKSRETGPLFDYGGLEPNVLVDNDEPLVLKVGQTEIHVLGLPAGEGPDGLGVWLPKERVLFSGDMTGPHFPMFPNLYSIRGERTREFLDYIHSVDQAIQLGPAVLAHGHFDVIRDEAYIQTALERMRDAVRYVHDTVVAGMNAGKSLPELMEEIRLPEALKLSEGYGKVPFSVRGLWETYTGWFQFESTTELYAVPVRAIYPELAKAAGGKQKLFELAEAHLDQGEPEKALHFAEIAESVDATHRPTLQVKRRVLVVLRDRAIAQTNNFMEVSWLNARIDELDARMATAIAN